ncbi:MAG: glycosyltransferase family 39 protein [Oscillospiraceae bacterium]|nr:glycosyltransferase family 39 protein [Oscillospiraceae bacterium]
MKQAKQTNGIIKMQTRLFNRNLLLIFAISFIVHSILNILLIKAPTVTIDEGLYTNIARSLAWEGRPAFRGQPVNYPYLLYPFLLVPLFLMNAVLGGDIFRYIQVFNTLLICTTVFPAYLFAKDFTNNEKRAVISALLVAVLPDLVMGGFQMTEALIWPLSFWMVFFSYRYYTEHDLKYGVMTALFCGLLFYTKPGALSAGTALLTLQIFFSSRRDKKAFLQAFVPLAVLLLMIGAVYGIYCGLFRAESSFLGLYDKQTSEWVAKDALVAGEASLLMLFLFVFACIGVFAILPFVYLKEYDKEKRQFIIALSCGVLVAIIGTAVFVVPYKWDGSLGQLPIHMRYWAMYIPAFFVFSSGLDLSSRTIGKGKRIKTAMIVFAVLAVFPGARAGFVKGETRSIDSMILSAFINTRRLNATISGWIVTIIILVFTVCFIIEISKGWKEKLKNASSVFLFVVVAVNALCAHINVNVYIDPTISEDAVEVKELIGKREALGITQRYYDDIYSYWLDGRLNYPMQQVTVDQMFVEMEEQGGIYTPFIPVDQSPNVNNHETPDTDLFVLGMTIAEHLELSDNTTSFTTKNGHFTVVQISPEVRWVDSMMYGLDDNYLYSGQNAILEFFDDSRDLNGLLHLSITASGSGKLLIGEQSIQLSKEDKSYDITLPYSRMITIVSAEGTAGILSYWTEQSS